MIQQDIFLQIGFAIMCATILGVLGKLMRQPLVVAYILTGFLLGPFLFGVINNQEVVSLFSTIGIAFLLFIVGMELNFERLKQIGHRAIIIGAVQIVASFILGYALLLFLGFTSIVSFYVSLALTFSSTVIVVKLLSDKKSLFSLHGKIALGILIVQDVVALLALILFSSFSASGSISLISGVEIFTKGIVLTLLVFFLGKFIFYRIFRYLAHSAELLFLASIAWCFFVSSIFAYLGFSIEMGAFVAGVTLAGLPFHEEITAKLVPLRDFFLILFFVTLGMQINPGVLSGVLLPTALLVLFVVIVKPFLIMLTMNGLTFNKRTSFFTAFSLSQISEFSLIIVALGLRVGHLDQTIVSMIVVVMGVTVLISSYIITYMGHIYVWARKLLYVLEIDSEEDDLELPRIKNHTILFGYRNLGRFIFPTLEKINKKIVVVDLDPDIYDELTKKGIYNIYGDAYDPTVLDKLHLQYAKMVVATFSGVKSNSYLVRKIREQNKKATIISFSNKLKDALALYEAGADYVIFPHMLSAQYLNQMLLKTSRKDKKLVSIRKEHLKTLRLLDKSV
ncbi:MAG: cation:proton antiporter [Patescibacteria group bacterium]